jgi:SAM-dependent methyltransferase/CheY-like chemotaxis protein
VTDVIRAVFVDDEAASQARTLFGVACEQETEVRTASGKTIVVRSESDPDALLRHLTVGGGTPLDVVLLDVDFSHSKQGPLILTDPVGTHDCPRGLWGFSILKTIKRIDPDLPVIMLTVQDRPSVSFEAAHSEADGYFLKQRLASIEPEMQAARQVALDDLWNTVIVAYNACRRRAIYDHEHLDTANQFAAKYNNDERSKLATVAYYHFENDLINAQVTHLLKTLPVDRRLRVLDIGCGTGRVEESLARQPYRDRIDVVAIDFAEKMVHMASAELAKDANVQHEIGWAVPDAADGQLHVSLFRAPAERLAFLTHRYPDGFDLAVLGFGFLSYVKYADVVPACPQKPPATGVVPVLRSGAPLIFSVYNENSAIYERIAVPDHDDDDLPIAALMDLTEGRLRVGEHYFACEAFTPARMMRFLRQGGLDVKPENVCTFPTAHLMLHNSDAERLPEDREFPSTGHFDSRLYAIDRDLSAVIKGRGHYVVGVATKKARPYVSPGSLIG